MTHIIAGGTGFIGRHLAKHWLGKNIPVTILGRSREKIQKVFGNQVTCLTWDELNRSGSHAIKDAEVIINLAGEGIGERRWSEARKKAILDSRIIPTQILANLCAQLGEDSPPLLNASAIGIYGLQPEDPKGLPPALDEQTPIDFNNYPDFLSLVGRKWEQATETAKKARVHVVNMRFAVVLSKEGGALPRIALPFKLFIGGAIGSGLQTFTWITLSDLIEAIDFLMTHHEISGPINLVAPHAITQKQLAKALGKKLRRPSFITTPAFILKLVFGQMADELLLKGQNVYPKRLLEYGFHFQFPEIDTALNEIYK